MSETFETISKVLDEGVEFAAPTSFVACHVDESCGQDGSHAGDVEVLAFLDPQGDAMDAESGALFAARYPNYTALVDRAHVTRLQEQCGRLDYDFATVSADLREMTAERDALKERVSKLDKRLREEQTYVSELAVENTALQSELTKARELNDDLKSILARARGCLQDIANGNASSYTVIREMASAMLGATNQSAPAAKGGE